MLEKLRKICLALPGVTEERMHGHPVFRVLKKPFCIYHGREGEEAVAVKVSSELQDAFLQDAFLKDARFFKTPHIARYGWISFCKQVKMPAAELRGLVEGSYALTTTQKKKKTT